MTHTSSILRDRRQDGPDEAEVRVFVQPGEYYNPPFDDPAVWTSFRLSSPDLNRPVYAFAKADDEMCIRMRKLVMSNPSLRQHMILKIKRQPGPHDKLLFSVEELVAVGWVKGLEDEN